MKANSSQLQSVVFDHSRHDRRMRDFDLVTLCEIVDDCSFALQSGRYDAEASAMRATLLYKAAREMERRRFGLALIA